MSEVISGFNVAQFWRFCAALKVDTKDRGLITLDQANLLGTQKYFVEQVAIGLSEGVHSFVVLKGRQLGITTISLAFDLFWLFKHRGVTGSLVTHDEESRDMFKSTLTMYIAGLPVEFKIPLVSHNRTQLVAKNRSRVSYQVAGTRKKGSLGRGKGLTFLHSTETSSYGDEEGLASLQASLSELHPSRLYIYESTARGFNMFYDMWERAKDSTTTRAIFIGWWRKETYRKSSDSLEYKTYWDGRLTQEEKRWTAEVKDLYDFDIEPEQIAWWRWKKAEEIGDDDLMFQEFPPTEAHAFVASGSNFFNTARLSMEMKACRQVRPDYYRFVLREKFDDSDVVDCLRKSSNLQIWEYPVQGAKYTIGADPAYGSSEWADRFSASVWRCWGDGMEQVAEFNTPDCSTYQFAWVILYLTGVYSRAEYQGQNRNVMLNLEINGPGQAVLAELQNMTRVASMTPSNDVSMKILTVARNLQSYLYKRLDTMGRPTAFHWKTSYDTKERMLGFFKDCFQRGTSTVRSTELIDEMRAVMRIDGDLGAPGRGKDDRVIAASLAHVAWSDYMRMQAISAKLVKPVSEGVDGPALKQEQMSDTVKGYLQRLGVKTS